MITYVVTDLFQSPARVLVNTVNTVGVMGAGIAKEFKRIYPEMFQEYQHLCERDQLSPGQLWLYRTQVKWILNFPTKKHWRQPSRPEYIDAGLSKFVETFSGQGITSISFPLLGCGNGELDWETQVRPLMEKHLKPLPIEVFIHLYRPDPFVPEHRDPESTKRWLRSEPEALAFSEVWDDLARFIGNGRSFDLVADSAHFDVNVTQDPEDGLNITDAEHSLFMAKDALLSLWQNIRGVGFCSPQNMPSGLDAHGPYVVAVLSRLPYLKPVLLSREYSKVTRKSIGLRLAPRSLDSEGPLFERMATPVLV